MTEEQLLSLKPDIPGEALKRRMKERFDKALKPIDGLGDFEDIIIKAGAAQETEEPDFSKKLLVILCADNGVVAEGVSQTDSSVTSSVAAMMGKKNSVVGVMLRTTGADSLVYDVGMEDDNTPEGVIVKKHASSTGNIALCDAMSPQVCLDTIETGIEIVRDQKDRYGIIATGEMGIGNTTTSTALLCSLTGADPEEITGYGAGLTKDKFEKKIQVIKKAIKRADAKDPLRALCSLGGLDIAAMAGVFIGGALYHVPVVIDGFISAVAALVAQRLVPGTAEYMLPSHVGKEKGTRLALDELHLKPVICADMALGEGTGAIMLFPLIDMVCNVYRFGPFFTDTDVKAYERNEK